jgi:ribosomal protein S21
VQVFVRDNNVEQALKALKRKMQREGVFREMKRRKHYEKPSERKLANGQKPSDGPESLPARNCSERVCCRQRNLGWPRASWEEEVPRGHPASDLAATFAMEVSRWMHRSRKDCRSPTLPDKTDLYPISFVFNHCHYEPNIFRTVIRCAQ